MGNSPSFQCGVGLQVFFIYHDSLIPCIQQSDYSPLLANQKYEEGDEINVEVEAEAEFKAKE